MNEIINELNKFKIKLFEDENIKKILNENINKINFLNENILYLDEYKIFLSKFERYEIINEIKQINNNFLINAFNKYKNIINYDVRKIMNLHESIIKTLNIF